MHRRHRPGPCPPFVRGCVPGPGHSPRPPVLADSHHSTQTPFVTNISAVQMVSEAISAEARMALRLLSPDRCHPVRAGGAGQGLGSLGARPRLRGAVSVLDVLAGEPIMAGQGEGRRPQAGNVYAVVSGPTVQPRGRAGAWLRSSLRGSRSCRPRGHGAVRVRAAGSIRGAAAPPGAGPDLRGITRCPCPGLLTRPLARGCGRPVTRPARRAARRRRR